MRSWPSNSFSRAPLGLRTFADRYSDIERGNEILRRGAQMLCRGNELLCRGIEIYMSRERTPPERDRYVDGTGNLCRGKEYSSRGIKILHRRNEVFISLSRGKLIIKLI